MTDSTSAGSSKPLVDQFHDMLHRDQTGLAAGLQAVLGVVGGFQWARESRGCYEWDDDRFHSEMGNMLDAVSKAANEALDRYRQGPLPCCVLERATPSETVDDLTYVTAQRDIAWAAIQRIKHGPPHWLNNDEVASWAASEADKGLAPAQKANEPRQSKIDPHCEACGAPEVAGLTLHKPGCTVVKASEAPPVDNDHVADGCEKFDV